jgi:ergothioneine biosynthesis protein EgtB
MASRSVPKPDPLAHLFASTRAYSLSLAAPLSDADATVQSMPDASPAKWHLAHTTWFFETFVLRDHVPGYALFDVGWPFLFNSYYEAEGDRHARPMRGMLTRPSLDQVRAYRAHVDSALADALPALPATARTLVELGCHHEAQHQELLLTDVLHLFAQNPLEPAYWSVSTSPPVRDDVCWIEGPHGVVEIGHSGANFAFDCEMPRHRQFLSPHAIADRLVTNADWAVFVEAGGYRHSEHWLSDGWAWVQREAITAPLYWREDNAFGLSGSQPRAPSAPVRHISFYEADAYARWAGARLPTEFEWEASVAGLADAFRHVWQWTASAFLPYPGFKTSAGAVGEYNGKFMSGQMVLRGSSVATPEGTSRITTRNFFPPSVRWQFSGLRLARDL